MSALVWPTKDPDEILDCKLDWSARLDGDTINTSTWIVPTGITKTSDTKTTSTTTIWLQGGTLGQTYEFVIASPPLGCARWTSP
jgi:hypothetical protein